MSSLLIHKMFMYCDMHNAHINMKVLQNLFCKRIGFTPQVPVQLNFAHFTSFKTTGGTRPIPEMTLRFYILMVQFNQCAL